MIIYKEGDLLSADAQALVNAVNTVGVMGKGIALQFKEQFPNNYNIYRAACKSGEMVSGKMLVVKERTIFEEEKIIINFPTKKDWKHKSEYEYIEEGLKDLVRVIKEYNIQSIAIPPLGCGNGGLDWEIVRPLMEKNLENLGDVEVLLFDPSTAIKELLSKQENRRRKN